MPTTSSRHEPLKLAEEALLLPEALRRRAETVGDRVAFSFVSDRNRHTSYTYAELDRRARAIAAARESRADPGSRAVLLFPPGLEFLAAFMACQYAGMVAVPVQPPGGLLVIGARRSGSASPRLVRSLERILGVMDDAEAGLVLTTTSLAGHADTIDELTQEEARRDWLVVDDIDDTLAERWIERPVSADDLCLLQYTSGSTSRPKGVAVRHRHVLSTASAIRQLAEFDPATDIGVSWLPPYHDMGLIGNMLQQVIEGYPQILLSPLGFLKRPLSWLQLVSEHRATISCAPTFGFDLCVEKASPEALDELDLSSLRVVVVGAEPVRSATLARFAEAFAPCGFDPAALCPCYGLAESTLIVTGRRGVSTIEFDREALAEGTTRRSAPGIPGKVMVSCGPPVGGARVLIVDPETGKPLPDGSIGEIWVDSDHVASGYYGRQAETEASFGAFPIGSERTGAGYLRTGDAGALVDGELFVTGRYKDLLVVGGANHHPHDIEETVGNAHPELRADRTVAFSVEGDGGETLVVGVDLRQADTEERAGIASAIRSAVFSEHGLSVHTLVALRAGALQKTSSGKPRRFLARQAFERGELGEVL